MQGVGKYHKELRIKTESKMVAFLNLQQFGFNELADISCIGRNGLRSSLDSLVDRKIVTKYRHHSVTNTKIDSEYYKVRGGIYYSLNKDNTEAKRLLDMYYNDRLPPPPKEIKEKLDVLQKYLSNQAKIVGEQADFFKKEVEPKLHTHEPNESLYVWENAVLLSREYVKQSDKIFKISAIKARLRLDYVNKKKPI
jgi:hypothetical protein